MQQHGKSLDRTMFPAKAFIFCPVLKNATPTFVTVKKLAATIFLSVYLLSTTQLSELLKLPVLIEHYVEHKEAKEDLTFFAFLKIHYAKGYADYDLDKQLPFKSSVNTSIVSLAFCASPQFIKFVPKAPVLEIKKQFAKETPFHSSSVLSSIWQPPRFC